MTKHAQLVFAVFFLVSLVLLTLIVTGHARVWAQKPVGPSRVAITQTSPSFSGEKLSPAAAFTGAAARNEQLRRSLSWVFGGKPQTGWEIYVPLISHTIGVDAEAGSPEFAAALSKWQAKNSLESTGVLEVETLQALIRSWQGKRLGSSVAPVDGSLLSAPITEFFDPTRDPGLLQLEQRTYAAYKRMIAAAAKDLRTSLRFSKTNELAEGEKFLRIVSAYRSPAYQEELRRKQPNAGRGALAKFSAHSTGQALDIYVGGEPVSTKDHNRLLQVQTPAYKWLVKNANRFGFFNYFFEPWHWEYVPSRLPQPE